MTIEALVATGLVNEEAATQLLNGVLAGYAGAPNESAENNIASVAAERGFQLNVDWERFPRNTDCIFTSVDEEGDERGAKQVFSKLETLAPFPHFPHLWIQSDIDSIYSHNTRLNTLLKAHGNMEVLRLRSSINANRKAYSSRFYVDCSDLENTTVVGSQSAESIPLFWFPNVEIAEIDCEGLRRPISIYFHCLKTKFIRKNQRFTKVQIAVISASLNIARILSLADTRNEGVGLQAEFHDFHAFEASYGNEKQQTASKEFNELNKEAAIIFASNFEKAMRRIATNDQNFKFEDYHINKIRSKTTSQEISRTSMSAAAEDMLEGMLFTSSIQGIKKMFHHNKYQTDLKRSDELIQKYQALFDNHQLAIHRTVKKYLQKTYETIPNHLNFSNSRRTGTRRLTMDDLPLTGIPFSELEGFFPDFRNDLNREFNKECQSVITKLHDKLKEIFGGPSNRVDPEIYFDIGLELRMEGNSSVLLDVDKAFEYLKGIANHQTE